MNWMTNLVSSGQSDIDRRWKQVKAWIQCCLETLTWVHLIQKSRVLQRLGKRNWHEKLVGGVLELTLLDADETVVMFAQEGILWGLCWTNLTSSSLCCNDWVVFNRANDFFTNFQSKYVSFNKDTGFEYLGQYSIVSSYFMHTWSQSISKHFKYSFGPYVVFKNTRCQQASHWGSVLDDPTMPCCRKRFLRIWFLDFQSSTWAKVTQQ